MTFQEKLAAKKKSIESNLPPSYIKIMHKATKDLINTGIQERALRKGEQLPGFELHNQNMELVSSSEELAKGPLIITFYRGFWCPYCNIDLSNLNNYTSKFEELGARMLTISPELPQYSKKISAMHKLNFDILWDKGNEVAEAFRLKFYLPGDLKELYRDKFSINLKLYHGDDQWALPIPARFIVNQEGQVIYAENSADYTKRPDPEELLTTLQSI